MGTARNINLAIELYKKSCESGIEKGCYKAAALLEKSPNKDYKTLSKVYRAACNNGYAEFYYKLGELYYQGLGVEKITKKLLNITKKSCDLKDGTGCYDLASLYERGLGVAKDPQKAEELYKKAAELAKDACYSGQPYDCKLLAYQYAEGKGVERDFQKAAYYYNKACYFGLKEGCDKYRKLSERLKK